MRPFYSKRIEDVYPSTLEGGKYCLLQKCLRNGRYAGKYESPLTVLTVQHLFPVNGSSSPIQVGECFSIATSDPFQNHFRSLPFTWSATSLFALIFTVCFMLVTYCIMASVLPSNPWIRDLVSVLLSVPDAVSASSIFP